MNKLTTVEVYYKISFKCDIKDSQQIAELKKPKDFELVQIVEDNNYFDKIISLYNEMLYICRLVKINTYISVDSNNGEKKTLIIGSEKIAEKIQLLFNKF